jgi:hypothetical protein
LPAPEDVASLKARIVELEDLLGMQRRVLNAARAELAAVVAERAAGSDASKQPVECLRQEEPQEFK